VMTCAPDGYPQAPYSRVVTLLRVSGKTTHNDLFPLVIALRSREEALPAQGGRFRAKRLSYSPELTATNAATPTPRSLQPNPRAPDSPARR
jgi:hypothetical protein